MSKLVIIDGNAIMHRAFHAIPALITKKGEPINAVYGLVSMLLKVITDTMPSHIAVAFDEKAPTFRQKLLPSYQAQRPPTANELSSQFAKARDFLASADIPVYSKAGYEADDVIGTIAVKSKIPVVIVTGDRDQLQLVSDKKNIKLYMPVVGFNNAKLFDEIATRERMGVLPVQIPDLKSLTGDASDNYFGVSGIGPKTAENLLSKYKTTAEIYKHIKEIPEKVREKLEKGKKSADQSYLLATIDKNVPIDFDFDEMGKWDIASSGVMKLFEEFGFKTLADRVKKVGKEIDDSKQGALF